MVMTLGPVSLKGVSLEGNAAHNQMYQKEIEVIPA
jgi:hypothetical protein|tara:strand:+ start:2468 stop:2572 length:105 start_codon:yes stop_codon:yes gene_type:complete